MTDYINREDAINAAIEGVDDWDGGYNLHRNNYIRISIKTIPAADVVEVIRCRDCKNYNEHLKQCFHKTAPGMWRDKNFFCANGERKTKNG